MRLIDADKLPVFDMVDGMADTEKGIEPIVTHWIQLDFITHAPTVKAIPIDFLERWFGDNYYAFIDLIMEWEKENGKN